MSTPTDRRPPWDALLLASFDRADATDRSSYNRTPTVSSGATIATRCMDFDGTSNAQVSYPDAAELDVSPMTIAFWVRIDSGNAGRINLIGKNVDSATLASWKGWYIHHLTTTYGILIATEEDALTKYRVRYYATATSWNDGVWRHLAWVMPDKATSSGWVFYVNGAAVSTTDASGAGTIATIDTAELLKVGGKTTNNQDKYLNGALDDIRIFSTAKTAGEIAEMYAQGLGVTRP